MCIRDRPYISGAAYIDRMGDYCGGCAFDPRTTCPVTPMYWAFLERHAETLRGSPRMRLPLASARKRDPDRRDRDRAVAARTADTLAAGRTLRPADLDPDRDRG